MLDRRKICIHWRHQRSAEFCWCVTSNSLQTSGFSGLVSRGRLKFDLNAKCGEFITYRQYMTSFECNLDWTFRFDLLACYILQLLKTVKYDLHTNVTWCNRPSLLCQFSTAGYRWACEISGIVDGPLFNGSFITTGSFSCKLCLSFYQSLLNADYSTQQHAMFAS